MKKNFTLEFSLRIIFIAILLIAFTSLLAQPDYYFSNPVLESGKHLQEGAVYRFEKVRTGVDALVEVKKFHGGVSLDAIDENWTGFDEAFQPFIYCPPGTDGYVEFEIYFVAAGTNNKLKQKEVPITPIDIDGGLKKTLHEQDQIKITNGYVDYDLLGTKLDMKSQSGGWYRAKDMTGVALDGIDTTDKQAMFTVVNADVDMIEIKMGANNEDDFNEDVRYRSVYFKKFLYPNAVLSSSCLKNFSGYLKNNEVNLQWTLSTCSNLKSIVIEKASSPNGFAGIKEIGQWETPGTYDFTDHTPGTVNYYRLKLISYNDKVEYSNILVLKANAAGSQSFKVYPSIINDNANVSISASNKEQTAVQLMDLAGRTIYTQPVMLQPGNNTFTISDLGRLPKGTYVAVVKNGTVVNSQKIIKQ
jgi:hypothetical protein